jgi:hypothetical protein
VKGKKLLGGKILRGGKKILSMLKNNIEVIRDPVRKKGKNAGKGNKGKETKGKDGKKDSGVKTTPAATSASP